MGRLRDLLSRKSGASLPSAPESALHRAVSEAMTDVRAYARSHGGDIELLGVTEAGEVTVRLAGACRGCPVSAFTLRYGVEEQLRVLVPGVTKIRQV